MTSGPTQTSAQRRARGLRRIEIWVPVAYVRKLDCISSENGLSRAEVLQVLIDRECTELQALKPVRNARRP